MVIKLCDIKKCIFCCVFFACFRPYVKTTNSKYFSRTFQGLVQHLWFCRISELKNKNWKFSCSRRRLPDYRMNDFFHIYIYLPRLKLWTNGHKIGSFSAFKVAASEKVDPGQTWTDELQHNGLKIILKGQEISDTVRAPHRGLKLPKRFTNWHWLKLWVPGWKREIMYKTKKYLGSD